MFGITAQSVENFNKQLFPFKVFCSRFLYFCHLKLHVVLLPGMENWSFHSNERLCFDTPDCYSFCRQNIVLLLPIADKRPQGMVLSEERGLEILLSMTLMSFFIYKHCRQDFSVQRLRIGLLANVDYKIASLLLKNWRLDCFESLDQQSSHWISNNYSSITIYYFLSSVRVEK